MLAVHHEVLERHITGKEDKQILHCGSEISVVRLQSTLYSLDARRQQARAHLFLAAWCSERRATMRLRD